MPRCPRAFRHYYIEGEAAPGREEAGEGRRLREGEYTSPHRQRELRQEVGRHGQAV